MRLRAFKCGNPFKRHRPDSTQRFAWLPRKLDNGTVVWLEWYTRRRKIEYGHGPL